MFKMVKNIILDMDLSIPGVWISDYVQRHLWNPVMFVT